MEDGAWRAFVCEHCGKGFSRRDVLKRHYQVHFKGEKDGSRNKRRKTGHDGDEDDGDDLAAQRDAYGRPIDRGPFARPPPPGGVQLHPAQQSDYPPYPPIPSPDKPICDLCRQANVACTDGIPCDRCARLGQACTYSASPSSSSGAHYAMMPPQMGPPPNAMHSAAPPIPGMNFSANPVPTAVADLPYDPEFRLDMLSQSANFDENTLAFLDWAAAGYLTNLSQSAQQGFVGQRMWEEPRPYFAGPTQPVLSVHHQNMYPPPPQPQAVGAVAGPTPATSQSSPDSHASTNPHAGITPPNLTLASVPSLGYDGVPHVTDATRDAIQAAAYDCQLKTAHSNDIYDVPSTAVLDTLLQTYFCKYAFGMRVLHFETFDPNQAPFYLVLAVAMGGARHATDIEIMKQGGKVLEITRRCLVSLAETEVPRSSHSFQFAHFLVLLASLFAGNQEQLEYAQASQGALIAVRPKITALNARRS